MTQSMRPVINANSTSGATLADYLNDDRDTILTQHSGTTEPSYAQVGTVWLNTSDGTLHIKTSAGDKTLLEFLGGANLVDIAALSFSAGDVVFFDGTDVQKLAIGAYGQSLRVNSAGTAPEWAYSGPPDFHVVHSGTDATGNIPFDTVIRNVLVGETVGASSIDLPAGTYYAEGSGLLRLQSNLGAASYCSIALTAGGAVQTKAGHRGINGNDANYAVVSGQFTNAGPGDMTVAINFARDNANFHVTSYSASGHSGGVEISGYLKIWRLA